MGSKMGPKPAAVLLFLSIIYLSLAKAGSNHLANPVEGDSNHLAKPLEDDSNQMDIDQVEHQLVKREAGRGRKKSCEGKRCDKKKNPPKEKKTTNEKQNNNVKKGENLRRKRLQRRKKKTDG